MNLVYIGSLGLWNCLHNYELFGNWLFWFNKVMEYIIGLVSAFIM